jgi:hypothetical protein
MSLDKGSFIPRRRDGERGQTLVMVPVLLAGLLCAAAVVVDIGNLYFSYQELLSATRAAAVAGGQAMPNGNATTVADQYSGDATVGALYNIHPNLVMQSVNVSYACVAPTTYSSLGLPQCSVFGSQPNANVIQVQETAHANTFFAKVFGVSYLTITATATASARGGQFKPYNIMMVLDTTASMNTGNDSGCVTGLTGTVTPEKCAQYGIQQLLDELDPCSTSLTTCGTGYTPVDQVGLMVFPGLCDDTATGVTTGNCPAATSLNNTIANSTYAPPDTYCPSTAPPIASYNNDPEYLLVGLSSNYRLSDTSALNFGTGNSAMASSAGAGTDNCGVQAPGGKSTFYGGVLVAAQQYLAANSRRGAQNVIIILSDGDANAAGTDMGGTVAQTASLADMNGSLFATTNECTQAIEAANYAKAAGTLVYSISYGSETSGCSAGEGVTPCQTMQGMASLPLTEYFFSVPDAATSGGTVCPNAAPITQLSQVFQQIGEDFTTSRLISNSVF